MCYNKQKGQKGGEENMQQSKTTSALGGMRGVPNKENCRRNLNESLNVEICGFLKVESRNRSPGIQI